MAKGYVDMAKKSLKKASELADENKEVSLTNNTYATLKAYVDAAEEASQSIVETSVTEENCEELVATLQRKAMDLKLMCFGIQAFSVKMLEAFVE